MAEDIKLRLQLDANDGIQSLRDLKKEIKDAQGDVVAMSEKFGATSEQARNAAQRVAELQDNLADAKALTDTFNPDKKFVALGQSLQGVLGGFTALTGAMGLLGVESEDVQKQLLKVQSAMAFSQGLNQVGDSIQSFKNLGKSIVDTLGKGGAIGLAIAGVGALVVAVTGLFEKNKLAAESMNKFRKGSLDAKNEVANLRQTIDLAKSGVVDKTAALEEYNNSIGKTIGQAKTLEEAEQLLIKNADNYVKVQGLKAKANFLVAKAAEIEGEAELARIQTQGGAYEGLINKAAPKAIAAADKIREQVKGINAEIASISQTAGFQPSTGKADTKKAGKEDPKIQAEKEGLDFIREYRKKNALASIQDENERAKLQLELEFNEQLESIKQSKASEETKNEQIKLLRENLRLEIGKIDDQIAADKKEKDDKEENDRKDAFDKLVKRLGDEGLAKNKSLTETAQQRLQAIADLTITEEQKELAALENKYYQRLELVKGNEAAEKALKEQFEKDKFNVTKKYADAEVALQIEKAQAIGNALGTLADLVGKQTAAGKALGIAQATINTWIGATEVLRAKSVLPEPAATISKIINVAAIIASGIKAIKNIVKVQVPGGGGSGGGGGSVPSAPAPLAPQAQQTILNQGQLNQMGNATVRAFVVESDVTNNQQRIRRLNRAARIG